jgi:hypothetical protein
MPEISADEAAFHATHSAVQQVEVDLEEVVRRLGDNALSPKSRRDALGLLRETVARCLNAWDDEQQAAGTRSGSAADPNKPAPSKRDPSNPVEDIPVSPLTNMIRDLCPSAWAPIEDAMLRALRHPGTGPGPEREGTTVPIGICVLTATEDMADVVHWDVVSGPSPKAPETPEAREIEAREMRFRKRNAGLRFVTVPVPYGAYFGLVAALEARIADGAVQRWCDQDPYGHVGRHDVVLLRRSIARVCVGARVLTEATMSDTEPLDRLIHDLCPAYVAALLEVFQAPGEFELGTTLANELELKLATGAVDRWLREHPSEPVTRAQVEEHIAFLRRILPPPAQH